MWGEGNKGLTRTECEWDRGGFGTKKRESMPTGNTEEPALCLQAAKEGAEASASLLRSRKGRTSRTAVKME